MVNLNRQIRATQARQGGFSAHVLPGAVTYEGCDRSGLVLVPAPLESGSWVLSSVNGSVPLVETTTRGIASTLVRINDDTPAGGAFALRATNPGTEISNHHLEAKTAQAAPGGSGKFTIEAYWRVAETGSINRVGAYLANGTVVDADSRGYLWFWLDRVTLQLTGRTANPGLSFASVSLTVGDDAFVADWHHYCASVNGNAFRLFVDGVTVASGTFSGSLSDYLFLQSWDVFSPFNQQANLGSRTHLSHMARLVPGVSRDVDFSPPRYC